MADHVLPLTHAGTATQASAVAFHVKAGELQAQLVWPVSALLVLYSCVVGHWRQAVSPSTEYWPAAQLLHWMLALGEQVETPSHTEPAAQDEGLVQAAQGARPVDDQVELATHGKLHVLDAVFHA